MVVAKRRRTFLCHALFFWVWEAQAGRHSRQRRTKEKEKEEEATIKLGDSIWDTIKKASP